MKKALSVLLIIAAIFGFYGGAVNLKDVLDCKAYWEEEGRKTDENLNKLEDGINQLKENEQAYLDGLDQVAQGEKDLAAGEADYAAGQKELAAGEADYAAAPAKLAAGEKQVAEGEALLNKLSPLLDNIKNSQMLFKLKGIMDGYNKASEDADKIKKDVEDYANTLINTGNSLSNKGSDGSSFIDAGNGLLANLTGLETDKTAKSAPVAAFAQRATAMNSETDMGFIPILTNVSEGYDSNLKTMKATIEKITALEDKEDRTPEEEATYNMLKQMEPVLNQKIIVLEGLKSTIKDPADGLISRINNWLDNDYKPIVPAMQKDLPALDGGITKALLDNKLVKGDKAKMLSAYDSEEKIIESNAPDVLVKLNEVFDMVNATVDDKKGELAAGKKKLAKGYADYKAAPGKLAAGRAQLAAGAAKLAQGRLDLADGKAQLAQYEDGEQQVRDGLATLFATEANGGLESIASRLNNDDNFDNEDGHLMLDRGLTGVQEGRNYSDDSSVVITKELTTRAIGTGAGLGAALLALIGAILCFAKKHKGAGVFAVLTGLCGVAGIVVAKSAGTEFSGLAGSPLSPVPYIAFAILAVVALAAAIANFGAKKDA